MRKLLIYIQDQFELSHSEAKSTFYFLVIIFLFSLALLIPKFISANENFSIFETYKTEVITYEKKKAREFKKTYENKGSKLRRFNPNTVEISELQNMGIPSFISKSMVNYRKSGAKYRKKEDLLKLYGINEEWYDKLEAYIDLPTFEEERAYKSYDKIYEPSNFPTFKKERKVITVFDINTAQKEDLTQITGIGEVFASRIIKYRDGLGGFYDINQVKSTYGLPVEAFDSLSVYAKIKTPPIKFNINELTMENFNYRHLKKYQVKVIVNYKVQHGDYKSLDDLQKIKVLDKELLLKLAPYISF